VPLSPVRSADRLPVAMRGLPCCIPWYSASGEDPVLSDFSKGPVVHATVGWLVGGLGPRLSRNSPSGLTENTQHRSEAGIDGIIRQLRQIQVLLDLKGPT
jgi:hypothetical protein